VRPEEQIPFGEGFEEPEVARRRIVDAGHDPEEARPATVLTYPAVSTMRRAG
jgi:hypothetical protein